MALRQWPWPHPAGTLERRLRGKRGPIGVARCDVFGWGIPGPAGCWGHALGGPSPAGRQCRHMGVSGAPLLRGASPSYVPWAPMPERNSDRSPLRDFGALSGGDPSGDALRSRPPHRSGKLVPHTACSASACAVDLGAGLGLQGSCQQESRGHAPERQERETRAVRAGKLGAVTPASGILLCGLPHSLVARARTHQYI